MTKMTAGPLELEWIGDFANIAEDPDTEAPESIRARFPKEAARADLSPGGTWFSTVEEDVLVLEGKRKVKRARRRLHWLVGGEVRVAKDLPVFHSVDFDEEAGIALLSSDLGQVLVLDLKDATIRPIPLEGYELSTRSRLQGIHFLRGGRVLIHDVAGEETLIVAMVQRASLTYVHHFAFEGDHTVVNGRILIGGGEALSVLDLAQDEPKELSKLVELSYWMSWRRGPGELRLYTHDAGAWDVRGFNALA